MSSFSVSCVSLTVSITSFQFLVSCNSCPRLIVVPLSLAITLSFVPADQIPIRTEPISYFHLPLMILPPPNYCFSQASILRYLNGREAMLFPSFPSDVDTSCSKRQGLVKVLRFAKEGGAMHLVGEVQEEEIRNIGNRDGVSCPLYNDQLASFSNAVTETWIWFPFLCFPLRLMAECCQRRIHTVVPSVMAVI